MFFLFWTGLVFIMGYAVMAGSSGRLVFGYDSFGNVCGKKNSPVEGAPLSGQDMTNKKHVFFMNSCNLEIKDQKINSIALCVSSCPQEQLNSLEEIQGFAKNNGSLLCVYSLNFSSGIPNPQVTSLCPNLPVPPSKSFPLFNRCLPQTPECYSVFAAVLINDVGTLQRILGGIMAGRETVLGLCVLSVALSFTMVLIFCCVTTLLVHIFITLVIMGLLFVSGVLWWLYYDYVNSISTELDTEKENVKFLLGFSIVSTVITVILLLLIFALRKKIPLAIELIQVMNKTLGDSPFLFLQPLWTFIILICFWVLWVAVLLSLGTAGTAQVISGGQVEYKPLLGIQYMWWYHLIGLIWTSEFILACQQMIVAGAVVTCFFNRNKNQPPTQPMISSLSILFCYHQGTVVKGSLLIFLVRIPRIVFMYVYNILKEQEENAFARCMFKCCLCSSCSLDRCLNYLNQAAFTTTAINGTDFCTSAKDAFYILSKHSGHITSINYFGDFIIFLGKVFVTYFTVFGGLMAFNYNRELQVWAAPLLLVAFFAYLVAHSFLSVFETVLDALFLCFAIDVETNDGSPGKPYFTDQEFMNFICRSSKSIDDEKKQRNKDTLNNEDGTELQPIVR
ncbi:choline transporter-like protein 3 isoform X4 [Tachyglossus aculeatus]|uniref:choline transporter-like protein 3 isoform X4 n=2 Tax=Tachyglossus aculeatus TaxID=9261 RepID=UPI0018F4F46E|nr:choline transporter-like protein 3 isoform X4 [Tachyglossus aculeatus]